MLKLKELKEWIVKIPSDDAEVKIRTYLNEPNICSITFVIDGEPYLSFQTMLDRGD